MTAFAPAFPLSRLTPLAAAVCASFCLGLTMPAHAGEEAKDTGGITVAATGPARVSAHRRTE